MINFVLPAGGIGGNIGGVKDMELVVTLLAIILEFCTVVDTVVSEGIGLAEITSTLFQSTESIVNFTPTLLLLKMSQVLFIARSDQRCLAVDFAGKNKS